MMKHAARSCRCTGAGASGEHDITGLHIEAETIEAFEDILFDVAADIIAANHPHNPVLKEAGAAERL